MPREKKYYRDQLRDIGFYFGHWQPLSVSEVAKYLGIKERTVEKYLDIKHDERITPKELARWLVCLQG